MTIRLDLISYIHYMSIDIHTYLPTYVPMVQLEALVRISESLAKMRLRPEVTQEDVREAIRLFQVCR